MTNPTRNLNIGRRNNLHVLANCDESATFTDAELGRLCDVFRNPVKAGFVNGLVLVPLDDDFGRVEVVLSGRLDGDNVYSLRAPDGFMGVTRLSVLPADVESLLVIDADIRLRERMVVVLRTEDGVDGRMTPIFVLCDTLRTKDEFLKTDFWYVYSARFEAREATEEDFAKMLRAMEDFSVETAFEINIRNGSVDDANFPNFETMYPLGFRKS